MKPTTYLATVSELNEELAKQRAIKEELAEALELLHEALRSGPPEVIGYDHNGANQKAFNHGWNSNADRLYQVAEKARTALARAKQ